MAELKPCPFCGGTPTVDDCGDHRYFVRCKCGIAQDKLRAQKCDAVRRWNTRKTLAAAQPEIIHCKDCKYHWVHRCMDSIPIEICDLNQTFYDAEVDFCSLAEKRGEADEQP